MSKQTELVGLTNPSQLLTSIKTVDGSGSGLDAELLSGVSGGLIADSCTLAPSASLTIAGGNLVSNFRTVTSHGSLTIAANRVTVTKAGVYQITQSFLFNTSTSGTNGDTRIRVNGYPLAAGYSSGADSNNWEKSVGCLVIYCAVGDYIDVSIQSTNHLWGSSSGYSHSTLCIVRVGS